MFFSTREANVRQLSSLDLSSTAAGTGALSRPSLIQKLGQYSLAIYVQTNKQNNANKSFSILFLKHVFLPTLHEKYSEHL